MHAPVFLVGAERSGTTLLRLMLDSHPEVSFIEEFEYVTDLVADDGTVPGIEEYGHYLETSRIFNTSGFVFRDDLPYGELVDGWLQERRRRAGASVAGATIHFGFSKALHVWPDARMIHIIRDPRDVAPSAIAMGWAGNTWWALNKWVEAEDEWDRVDAVLPDDRKLTVRYTDLVADHVTTLTRICDFLGVEYTEAMFDYVDRTDYDRPDPTKASSWERKLSTRDIRLAEARVGLDRLRAKGFEPSGHAPIEPGAVEREWLHLQDRIHKVKARVEVYGPRFTVEHLLARATGSEDWQRRLQLQAAEVEKGLLKRSWDEEPQPQG